MKYENYEKANEIMSQLDVLEFQLDKLNTVKESVDSGADLYFGRDKTSSVNLRLLNEDKVILEFLRDLEKKLTKKVEKLKKEYVVGYFKDKHDALQAKLDFIKNKGWTN
jgi:hypothetical protein